MSTTPDFKTMLDLACERSTSTSPFIARRYYEDMLMHASRKAHVDDIKKRGKILSRKIFFACAMFVLGLTVLTLSFLFESASELIQTYSDQIAGASAVCCTLSIVFLLSLSGKSESIAAEELLLNPIGDDPEQCLELKELTLNSNAVAHYVKNTVDRFEQLTAGDMVVARALAKGEKKYHRNEQGKAACLDLHLLASAQAK